MHLRQLLAEQPQGPAGRGDAKDPAWDLGRAIADRYDSTMDHDDFTQPGNLYRLFDDAHRDRLARRIAHVLGQARKEVQTRQLGHFFRAGMDYGRRVAERLGIEVAKFTRETEKTRA